ncbi:MAG: PAS domain S-box protein [Planctomycetes bacterium]|nr:PAS domain S-box protein [Planctomycetota bacterium]
MAKRGPPDPVHSMNAEQLVGALRLARVGVWDLDLATGKLTLSPENASLFGMAPAELPDDLASLTALVYFADREAVSRALEEALRIDALLSVEFRIAPPLALERWVASEGTVVRDTAGRAVRVVGVHLDITERKVAERALRENERRLAGVIDSAMDAILSVDEEQRIVLFNGAAERMFRCTANEALGEPLERFLPERFRTSHFEYVRDFGRTGGTNRRMGRLGTVSGLRSDGTEFPLEASISQAEIGGEKLYTVILRDVSERKRLEEELLHSRKMDAIGRLAGGIAHDFNNFLTVILGCCELAQESVGSSGTAHAAILQARTAAERASNLTQQLLAFARKQAIEPRILDVNSSVRSVESMLRRLIGEHIQLELELGPDTGAAHFDGGQFEQVLVNLALNARDAMHGGGRLRIRTRRAEVDGERARGVLEPGSYIELEVSDTGIGMGREVQTHLFEPFFTTKERGRGTGLGLAICHGLVTQHRGAIEVESVPQAGTTLRVLLPRLGGVATAPEPARVDPVGGDETILLVEDDVHVREVALASLRSRGYDVLAASSGPDALELVRALDRPLDLLFTDVVMGRMSGTELAVEIRRVRPATKILFASGYTEVALREQALTDLGAAFLRKPYTPEALRRKVRELLDSL